MGAHKYGSWWREQYQATQVLNEHDKSLVEKPRYTICTLVTDKEYVVDVTHIRPFYCDPAFVTPLNIAVKDTDETVVDMIVKQDFSDPKDKKWSVRWITEPPSMVVVEVCFGKRVFPDLLMELLPVPLDADQRTLTNLRKTLPPKPSTKYKPGQSVINSIDTYADSRLHNQLTDIMAM